MPEVSVIIPTYNSAIFIGESILSVKRQTVRASEIIVVDDGSTDNTRSSIAAHQSDISYLFQENKGASSARNKGIMASRGDFVLFLDADDIFEDVCIEKHLEQFNTHNSYGMSYSALSFIGHRGKQIGNIFRAKEYDKNVFFVKMLERNLIASTSGVMLAREVLDDVGYFNENITCNEEYELWLKVAQKWAVSYIDKPLLRYRRHDGNISKNVNQQRKNETKIIQSLKEDCIKEKVHAAYSDDSDRFLSLGKIFFKRKEYTQSLSYLKRSIVCGENTDEGHFLIGSCFYLDAKYDHASSEYRKSLAINKENAASLNNLGILSYREGNRKTALEFFIHAHTIKKNYYDVSFNIECLKGHKRFEEMNMTLFPLRKELVPYT